MKKGTLVKGLVILAAIDLVDIVAKGQVLGGLSKAGSDAGDLWDEAVEEMSKPIKVRAKMISKVKDVFENM